MRHHYLSAPSEHGVSTSIAVEIQISNTNQISCFSRLFSSSFIFNSSLLLPFTRCPLHASVGTSPTTLRLNLPYPTSVPLDPIQALSTPAPHCNTNSLLAEKVQYSYARPPSEHPPLSLVMRTETLRPGKPPFSQTLESCYTSERAVNHPPQPHDQLPAST